MRPPIEVLAQRYRQSLYAAAFSVCRNAQDAEDAVQDTFLQYLAQNKQFESEQHVRAWLLAVAINKARDRVRSLSRKNTLPLEDYMSSLVFETPEASEVFAAVMALPEKYRIAVHLFYYEDYTVAEIAHILKLTAGNVRVRLSRGRALLRDTLKEAWEDDE